MKKVFVSCILLIVGFVVAGNFKEAKAPQDRPQPSYFIMSPSATVQGSIAKLYKGADSAWRVKDQYGIATYAKAIRVISKTDSGYISVHHVDNPAGSYSRYFIRPTDTWWYGLVFDIIYKTTTTINLDSCEIGL
jgi:hypothetical protein